MSWGPLGNEVSKNNQANATLRPHYNTLDKFDNTKPIFIESKVVK